MARFGISTVLRIIHALVYENFNDFCRNIDNEVLLNDISFKLQKVFI